MNQIEFLQQLDGACLQRINSLEDGPEKYKIKDVQTVIQAAIWGVQQSELGQFPQVKADSWCLMAERKARELKII